MCWLVGDRGVVGATLRSWEETWNILGIGASQPSAACGDILEGGLSPGKEVEMLGSQPRWELRDQERFEDSQASPQGPPAPTGREAERNEWPSSSQPPAGDTGL